MRAVRHAGAPGNEYFFLPELEIVADWREDLHARIARARLRQEYGSIHPDDIIALGAETEDFKRVCCALKEVIKR